MGALDPAIQELAQAANFAALTVHLESGAMMTHVMWVDADDDHILLNTEIHRVKFRMVERDPRVTVIVWVKDDPYRFAEVRGRVVDKVIGPAAEAHIEALAHLYTGAHHETRIRNADHLERVILKIAPEVQRTYDMTPSTDTRP